MTAVISDDPSLTCRLAGMFDLTRERETELAVANGTLVTPARSMPSLHITDALVFPGLINSHDHLGFNLYPQLGQPPYADYIEWGLDIQARHQHEIRRIERIPLTLRTQWGELKNLTQGVTTVADHEAQTAPLRVLDRVSDYQYLHSLAFHRRWWWQVNKIWLKVPLVTHLGEGVSARMKREVQRLVRVNLARRRVIAVHGMTMTPKLAPRFAALIWCPDSNHWLYGQSAPVTHLKACLPILFGTDSTLTASSGLLAQMRRARELGELSDHELFGAVTHAAAEVWGLPDRGHLALNGWADLVVARKTAARPWDAFFNLRAADLLLVLKKGRPILIDDSLREEPVLKPYLHRLFPFQQSATCKKWIPFDVPKLEADTRTYQAPVRYPLDWLPSKTS